MIRRQDWGWLAGVGLILFILVLIVTDALGGELGSLADWIEALGTTAAFAATYLLLRHELRSREEDEQVARERAYREAREEALKLEVGISPTGTKDVRLSVEIRYHNKSLTLVATEIVTVINDPDGNELILDELGDLTPQEHPYRRYTIRWIEPSDLRWFCQWTDNETGARWQRDHRNIVRRLPQP